MRWLKSRGPCTGPGTRHHNKTKGLQHAIESMLTKTRPRRERHRGRDAGQTDELPFEGDGAGWAFPAAAGRGRKGTPADVAAWRLTFPQSIKNNVLNNLPTLGTNGVKKVYAVHDVCIEPHPRPWVRAPCQRGAAEPFHACVPTPFLRGRAGGQQQQQQHQQQQQCPAAAAAAAAAAVTKGALLSS